MFRCSKRFVQTILVIVATLFALQMVFFHGRSNTSATEAPVIPINLLVQVNDVTTSTSQLEMTSVPSDQRNTTTPTSSAAPVVDNRTCLEKLNPFFPTWSHLPNESTVEILERDSPEFFRNVPFAFHTMVPMRPQDYDNETFSSSSFSSSSSSHVCGSTPPYLTLVLASRNDNYGGEDAASRIRASLRWTDRMAQRYGIAVEMIVVEWNPPPGQPLLWTVLPLLPNVQCVRIITVPTWVHEDWSARHRREGKQYPPVHEFLAKNIGIRRARGKWLMPQALDTLMSEMWWKDVADGLLERSERAYQLDALANPLVFQPGQGWDLEDDMRIWTSFLQKDRDRDWYRQRYNNMFKGRGLWREMQDDARLNAVSTDSLHDDWDKIDGRRRVIRVLHRMARIDSDVALSERDVVYMTPEKVEQKLAEKVLRIWGEYECPYKPQPLHLMALGYLNSCYFSMRHMSLRREPFEQASGDFTLMRTSTWRAVKGYTEQSSYAHFDSAFVNRMLRLGFAQHVYAYPRVIWHQGHKGGLAQRMANYYSIMTDFRLFRSDPLCMNNPDDWGMRDYTFPEVIFFKGNLVR